MSNHHPGLSLERTPDDPETVDAYVAAQGGRVGLAGVLEGLDRKARRGFAPGRSVHRSLTWNRLDRGDGRWWPQGITTSADGCDDEMFQGRRLALVSWYARGRPGVRISVLDLDTRRYTHVLVVDLDPKTGEAPPLQAHAGGIVWHRDWLHVAATARGIHTCRLDDIVALPKPRDACLFALPVRHTYDARTDAGTERVRYSFLSLDRAAEPARLVFGEYGHGTQTRRLGHYEIDPATGHLTPGADGVVRPVVQAEAAAVNSQGAVVARGRWHLTVSRSEKKLGSMYAGQPGALRRRRWATPMGPEDLTWWPSTDLLWSVTEHRRRRWVFSMKRGRLRG